MHGRLKVKTTAEQQAAKEKERAKKLALYTGGTKLAFAKRSKNEYDNEALEITGQLLGANPDFSTLWNFRREIFIYMKKESTEEEYQKLVSTELQFLEACLQVNPKSYGTWHHRGWVLQSSYAPDWKKELTLCNKYLEYDERNFHCWDYRRLVVKSSNVSANEEFEFTTKKISTNFSNFSSWHYRSKLLPLLHPDKHNWIGVKEEQLLPEFELAQNAFFTDPNDQSAWFYHRWLLGRADQPEDILSTTALVDPLRIVVTLTKAVSLSKGFTLKLELGDTHMEGTWESYNQEEYSDIWLFPLTLHSIAEVTISLNSEERRVSRSFTLNPKCLESSFSVKHYENGSLFKSQLSTSTSDILEQELEACEQLCDLEPDNKWTLLTIISLMRALNPISHEKHTLDYLVKLIDIDPMRRNYYEDLKSKFLIENAIEARDQSSRALDLSRLSLTSMHHLSHMTVMTTVNLSSNNLKSVQGLECLLCVECLNLDSNFLTSCAGLEKLTRLKELSIKDNNLTDVEAVEPLSHCSSLVKLVIDNNPVHSAMEKLCALLHNTSIV